MSDFEAFIKGQPYLFFKYLTLHRANSSVYGSDLNTKTRLYLSQTESVRLELRATHLRALEEGCDRYLG